MVEAMVEWEGLVQGLVGRVYNEDTVPADVNHPSTARNPDLLEQVMSRQRSPTMNPLYPLTTTRTLTPFKRTVNSILAINSTSPLATTVPVARLQELFHATIGGRAERPRDGIRMLVAVLRGWRGGAVVDMLVGMLFVILVIILVTILVVMLVLKLVLMFVRMAVE